VCSGIRTENHFSPSLPPALYERKRRGSTTTTTTTTRIRGSSISFFFFFFLRTEFLLSVSLLSPSLVDALPSYVWQICRGEEEEEWSRSNKTKTKVSARRLDEEDRERGERRERR
jgi:hypothetical protein